jgi:hypothetical protein
MIDLKKDNPFADEEISIIPLLLNVHMMSHIYINYLLFLLKFTY